MQKPQIRVLTEKDFDDFEREFLTLELYEKGTTLEEELTLFNLEVEEEVAALIAKKKSTFLSRTLSQSAKNYLRRKQNQAVAKAGKEPPTP